MAPIGTINLAWLPDYTQICKYAEIVRKRENRCILRVGTYKKRTSIKKGALFAFNQERFSLFETDGKQFTELTGGKGMEQKMYMISDAAKARWKWKSCPAVLGRRIELPIAEISWAIVTIRRTMNRLKREKNDERTGVSAKGDQKGSEAGK